MIELLKNFLLHLEQILRICRYDNFTSAHCCHSAVFISFAIFMSRIFSSPTRGAVDEVEPRNDIIGRQRNARPVVLTTDGKDGRRSNTSSYYIPRRCLAMPTPLQLFLSRSIAASRRVRRYVTTTGEWRHQIYRTRRWHGIYEPPIDAM